MKEHLTFRDDNGDLFWEIETQGTFFTVCYGIDKQKSYEYVRNYKNERQCLAVAERLVQEKLKLGYWDNENGTSIEREFFTKNVKTLHYNQSGTDRVYCFIIEPKKDGYMVNFSFGKRNERGMKGSKTPRPVSYEEAIRIRDQSIAALRMYLFEDVLESNLSNAAPEVVIPDPEIVINLWDDYPEDEEPLLTEAYVDHIKGRDGEGNEYPDNDEARDLEIVTILSDYIATNIKENPAIKEVTFSVVKENQWLLIENLKHTQRKKLVSLLNEAKLFYKNIPITIISES